MKYIKVGLFGFLISFLGTLPPGTITITAFDIAASGEIIQAFWFLAAAVLVELIIVKITLIGSKKINFDGKWSFYMMPIGIVVLVYLAISNFMKLGEVTTFAENNHLFSGLKSSFLLGMLLSVLNPILIPFWLGWNRVMISKNLLNEKLNTQAPYILGIGLGVFGALVIFIYAGKYAFLEQDKYGMVANIILGILYLGFALYLLVRFNKKIIKFKTQ